MKNFFLCNKISRLAFILLITITEYHGLVKAQNGCVTSVYPSTMNFTVQANETSIIGLSLTDPSCSYGVIVSSTASSWLTVTKNSNYQWTATCTPNSTTSTRNGYIYIDNARYTITVTQACLPPSQPNGANLMCLFVFPVCSLFCSSFIFSVWFTLGKHFGLYQ